MNGGPQHRRRAAVLLVVAWLLALHAWVPALLVGAFLSWAVLHKRLEGVRWRRAWPPGNLVLLLLLGASTLAFWISDVRPTAKVLPVALNIVGLTMILFGGWPTRFRRTAGAPRPAIAT